MDGVADCDSAQRLKEHLGWYFPSLKLQAVKITAELRKVHGRKYLHGNRMIYFIKEMQNEPHRVGTEQGVST